MDATAKVTSKGQLKLPTIAREALGIRAGDEVVFRVEGRRVVLARLPSFLELAGTFKVPSAKRNIVWDEVIRRARATRVTGRR
jgi:antitoxin PrlF